VVATGVAAAVVPRAWTGQEVARAADEAMRASIEGHEEAPAMVVGAIPFDARRPGVLYRPVRVVVQVLTLSFITPKPQLDFVVYPGQMVPVFYRASILRGNSPTVRSTRSPHRGERARLHR